MGTNIVRTDQFKSLLAQTRTVAVVGACCEPDGASYQVPDYLHAQGFHVVPVSAMHAGEQLWGEPVRASLAEIAEPVDVVCIFRGHDRPSSFTKDLLSMKHRPNAVWLPPGVQDVAFAKWMAAAGLDVVKGRCMATEHKWATQSVGY